MLVFFVGLACTQAPQEPLSLATDFYYEPVIGFSLQSPSFDSLDIRWARPIASIHKSNDWLETRFPDGSRQRCSIKAQTTSSLSLECSDRELSIKWSAVPNGIETNAFKMLASTDGPGSKVLVHSKKSLEALIDEHDYRVVSDTLSKLSGTYVAVSGDEDTKISVDSPLLFSIDGKALSVSARTCLMLRDVKPPHESVCIVTEDGAVWANEDERWHKGSFLGNSPVDRRRFMSSGVYFEKRE